MKRNNPLVSSVHQRLLNVSKKRVVDFNLVLVWYAAERLLYRLSNSEYARDFVLKGAMLYTAWTGRSFRPTKDLDLLGYGDVSAQRLTAIFQRICRMELEPDGLDFDPDSIEVTEIRQDQEYQGQSVRVLVYLGNARIRLQVDVGFGDVVTPEALEIEYPTLLDFPAPHIRVYPRETVVAEKFQAIVRLGMQNSRMKDFYDLWMIAKRFSFEGPVLVRAIEATFDRRNTQVPASAPVALSNEFSASPDKHIQWKAFLKRSGIDERTAILGEIIDELRAFLMSAALAAVDGKPFDQTWTNGGPWS